LLLVAIGFAKSFLPIEEEVIHILKHCRKSLLFDGNSVWAKKNNPDFDVTMGSYDGAEVCELVGLFLLHQMREKFPDINFGLYRDDGLGFTTNLPPSQLERTKKSIVQLFNSNGLKITIDMNLKQVNFLDVSMNLETDRFWPYRKPNDEPLYINKSSNHPPSVLKELPKMIEKRVSELSCDVDEFVKCKSVYEEALARSGFHCELKYAQPTNRRNRPRNIIWYNPPFNASVKTNIGKIFIALINKHFPNHHKYHKLFNRNNVKLSYSCTKNLASIIASHNKKIIGSGKPGPLNEGGCNCRKHPCPVNGRCQTNCVIYRAQVTTETTSKSYIGSTETDFKCRWRNHNSSFKKRTRPQRFPNAPFCYPTSLARYVWEAKDSGDDPNINWSQMKRAVSYRCGGQRCNLCLEEKLAILLAAPNSLINKRSELLNRCPHKRKHRLISLKSAVT